MERYDGITPEGRDVIERAEKIAEYTYDYLDSSKMLGAIAASGVLMASIGAMEAFAENTEQVGAPFLYFGMLAVAVGALGWIGQKFKFMNQLSEIE